MGRYDGGIEADCGGTKARDVAAGRARVSFVTSGPKRIAVVEDEETIREGVCLALRRDQCEPLPFADGQAAWEALQAGLPDLAILDIGVPRMDGLELCRRLRARSERLPIIFVTSREEEFDRVLGLEIGADDYLCKPFSMRELMARVKVLLRRAAYSGGARPHADEAFIVGDLVVDPVKLAVSWKGAVVGLTVTEFLVVQALARRPGAVLSRDQLMDSAYPDRTTVSDRTIDSHVKRIRKKFLGVDAGFSCIDAVYGAGYRYGDRDA